MRILQLSDIHLRIDGQLSFGKMNTMENFRMAIDHFEGLKEKPDMYIITGDLADNGNRISYEVVKAMLERLNKPVYIVPGNHDNREDFLDIFGEMCPVKKDISPYICYSIDDYPVRVIGIETIDQGKHWGKLSEKVAVWLEEKLKEEPEKPTMVFTHHPPFTTGLTKMDEPFGNVEEFARILKTHNNLTLCCGHLHRGTIASWQGIRTMICPPISMLMDIDFSPEGGDAFYLADPGYLLHTYIDGNIVSYVETIPTGADYSGPHPFVYLDSDKH